jgi:hypothetical protein
MWGEGREVPLLIGTRHTVGMWLVLVAALLHPNSSPKSGELGAFYFDVLNESQVWVDLHPRVLDEGPNPVRLNVTVAFPGRTLASAPPRVTVRATSDDSAFPLRIRVPVLRFDLHNGTAIDLTGPGSVYQFQQGCENCAANMLVTDVKWEQLQTITDSPLVEVEALGFRLRLAPADITALRKLVTTVSEGVTLAEH